MADMLNFDNVLKVLQDYAVEVRNLYQDSLIRHDRIASGGLLNSAECRVDVGDRSFEVVMSLEDYWRYVEEDTRPHWPPVSAILRWVQIKPVIPRPDAAGRIPAPKQLAYLIGRKIAREGTKGSHDLADAVAEMNNRYRERLSEALGADISAYITYVFTNAMQ